jgi:23S rRNA (cytosine1962-C5)-methyltransferase
VRWEGPLPVNLAVRVVGPDGTTVGHGLLDPHANVPLRIYYWGSGLASRAQGDDLRAPTDPDPEAMVDAEVRARLLAACDRRKGLESDKRTDAYRVVHSEGDGLSGLIIDRCDPRS